MPLLGHWHNKKRGGRGVPLLVGLLVSGIARRWKESERSETVMWHR